MHPKRIAIYTGSFDPFHLGHEDVVRRAAKLFDQVIIGVGENPDKKPFFAPDRRVALIEKIVADVSNISVESFQGLTVRFAQNKGAKVLVRGIRAFADFEYEFSMSLTNHCLDSELETVFLMSRPEFHHLSSTLIRQVATLGGNLQGFVSEKLIAEFFPAAKTG